MSGGVTVTLEPGDCREVLLDLAAAGQEFDSCVTDPPYDLTSVVRRFGKPGAAPAQYGTDGLFARQSRGFMGKEWDGTGVAFEVQTWRRVFEVLKPGGHLLAFGGTRTFHRMAVAIEDAGFEIRDCIMWMYGTGFPKSHDVSKGIDAKLGGAREVVGTRRTNKGDSGGQTYAALGEFQQSREVDITAPATPEAARWTGWGTALKPAFEPVIVARRPLAGTVAENVLQFGTGGLNIDGCRVGAEVPPEQRAGQAKLGTFERFDMVTPERVGRWPANVIHDGSPEVEEAFAAFGDRPGQLAKARTDGAAQNNAIYGAMSHGGPEHAPRADSGTASRFFYSAKASKADRAGSRHPTVKPLSLMRYLCRLVTPPGGTVLDPFAGSGTTLRAAAEEGFSAVGIERDPEYWADIRRRIESVMESQAAELAGLCA